MKFLGIVGQTDYRSAPKNGIRLTAVIKSIPWGHNQRIMYKCNNIAEALFYAQKTMDNGWSKKIGAITHRDEPNHSNTSNPFKSLKKSPEGYLPSRLSYISSEILLYVLQISVSQHLKFFVVYFIEHLLNRHTLTLVPGYRPNFIFRLILQKCRQPIVIFLHFRFFLT